MKIKMKKIKINNFLISNDAPFCLIVGPCVLESRDHAIKMAKKINKICNEVDINFIFKASFDKANRSSAKSERGVGLEKSLEIFSEIKDMFKCPILTDVHNENQCEILSKTNIVDIIQIPAFLSRQTDLLIAAGKTNKIINVKKGQFLSPNAMLNIIEKISMTGNNNIMLTERGVSFGYNNLVSDFRSIEIMKKFNYPIVYDATHSVQEPGGLGRTSGGKREFVPALSRAAVAVGVAGLFIETHDDPDNAPSDGPNMIDIKDLKSSIETIEKLIESKTWENSLEHIVESKNKCINEFNVYHRMAEICLNSNKNNKSNHKEYIKLAAFYRPYEARNLISKFSKLLIRAGNKGNFISMS